MRLQKETNCRKKQKRRINEWSIGSRVVRRRIAIGRAPNVYILHLHTGGERGGCVVKRRNKLLDSVSEPQSLLSALSSHPAACCLPPVQAGERMVWRPSRDLIQYSPLTARQHCRSGKPMQRLIACRRSRGGVDNRPDHHRRRLDRQRPPRPPPVRRRGLPQMGLYPDR